MNKISEKDLSLALTTAMKVPGVRINREKFLKKEFNIYCTEDIVCDIINNNPASAGVRLELVNKIANNVINYETNKVSAVSFLAGLPGGFAMAVTIPADVIQYFAFILRVMQKLAYLYGFEEFELNEDEIPDETLNQLLIFLGIMFGVQEANAAVKMIAEVASKKVAKSLAQRALTKGTIYPIVKKIAGQIGIKMTKQLFADGVSKFVPIAGGFVAGGLTYVTFKPSSKKLQKSFSRLPISSPETYATQKAL